MYHIFDKKKNIETYKLNTYLRAKNFKKNDHVKIHQTNKFFNPVLLYILHKDFC